MLFRSPFFHALRHALQEAAPAGAAEPRAVLLGPGPGSETAFDQAYLASMLGLPLVEGDDLGTYVCKFRGAGQGLRVLVAVVVLAHASVPLEGSAIWSSISLNTPLMWASAAA